MGARGSERGAPVCEVRRHGVQRDGVRDAARRCARCGATVCEMRRDGLRGAAKGSVLYNSLRIPYDAIN